MAIIEPINKEIGDNRNEKNMRGPHVFGTGQISYFFPGL